MKLYNTGTKKSKKLHCKFLSICVATEHTENGMFKHTENGMFVSTNQRSSTFLRKMMKTKHVFLLWQKPTNKAIPTYNHGQCLYFYLKNIILAVFQKNITVYDLMNARVRMNAPLERGVELMNARGVN